MLPGDNIKVSYKKLSLKVHPDKNCHPGATNAFKKLNDAHQRLSQGGYNGSEPALKITQSSGSESVLSGNPPKVISVTTNK